jgi:hypothetical protein
VWPWLLVGALIVAAGAVLYWRRRGDVGGAGGPGSGDEPGRAGDGADGAADLPPTIEDLRASATAALIAVDDSIRTSEQEVGFASAEVGQDGVEPFAAAIDLSKHDMTLAVGLLREAQSCEAVDPELEVLAEIIATCARADSRLDDLATRFDALRDLEGRAAEILPTLDKQTAALEERLVRATATLDDLRTEYPYGTVAGLLDDLDRAAERLQFASASVAIGLRLLDGADHRGAGARARACEEALGQANSLLDWVDSAPQVLLRARDVVTTLLTEAERDIADAERLGVTEDLAAKGRYARETLGWAGEEVASGEYDPLAMRRALEDTNTALGRALGPIRADEESDRRAAALLASAWYGARATVGSADRYITTRRGAVGVEARTRLSEARSAYVEGIEIGDSDPRTALQRLRTADSLADQARALAQQDEAAYRNTAQMGGGMGELGAMLLGGILIGEPAQQGAEGGLDARAVPPLGPGAVSFGGRATRGRRLGAGDFQE